MEDYIVRGTAAAGEIRAFAATTRNLVEHARQIHETSPVVTAALGRLLTAPETDCRGGAITIDPNYDSGM